MCVCSLHSKYPSLCLNIYCCSDIYLRWPMAFASLIFPHALMLVARETVRAWDWETVRRRRCSFRWHPHAWRHDPVSRLKRLVSVGPMTRRRAAPVRLWIRVYGVYIIQKKYTEYTVYDAAINQADPCMPAAAPLRHCCARF